MGRNKPESTKELAERTAQQTVRKEISAVFHRGPMPSPDVMAKYEELYPGAVEFFFDQFRLQTQHRQTLEAKVVDSNVRSTTRGQWMAFVLFSLVTIGGFAALFAGYSIEGTISALAGLGAVLVLFFNRRKRSDSELADKDR